MPLAKCARCKNMFNKTDRPICADCDPLETSDYDKVRAILEAHPDLNAEEAAEKAEVDIAVITRMLKDGLLADNSTNKNPTCGQCGAPALSASKRLCQPCLDKMNAGVARAQASLKLEERKHVEVGEYMNARAAFDNKRRN